MPRTGRGRPDINATHRVSASFRRAVDSSHRHVEGTTHLRIDPINLGHVFQRIRSPLMDDSFVRDEVDRLGIIPRDDMWNDIDIRGWISGTLYNLGSYK